MHSLIIFASGTGSNAKKIIEYFEDNDQVEIVGVFSNNNQAPVLKMAENKDIKTFSFDRNSFYKSDDVLHILKEINPDLIILAGFMWIVPERMIDSFPNKIINIHPSLLPKYGGKGMYGNRVHKAVLANRESETGISIHYVNKYYDEGKLIAQFKINLSPDDDLEKVVEKIHKLEHANYAKVIEQLLLSK